LRGKDAKRPSIADLKLDLRSLTKIWEKRNLYFGDDFLLSSGNIQAEIREIICKRSRTANNHYEPYQPWTSAGQLSH